MKWLAGVVFTASGLSQSQGTIPDRRDCEVPSVVLMGDVFADRGTDDTGADEEVEVIAVTVSVLLGSWEIFFCDTETQMGL